MLAQLMEILTPINHTTHLSIKMLGWLSHTTDNLVLHDPKEPHDYTNSFMKLHDSIVKKSPIWKCMTPINHMAEQLTPINHTAYLFG